MSTPDVPSRQAIADLLRAANIPHADAIAGLAEPSWKLIPAPTPMAEIAMGESRFGGVPDLPADFEWPTRNGHPLSFATQLDLAVADAPDLPREGWLVFFFDALEEPDGWDPGDAGGAHVAYFDGPLSSLIRRAAEPNADIATPWEPCAVSFAVAADLPDPGDSPFTSTATLEDWLDDTLAAAKASVSGTDDEATYHHLLGHPQAIQGDMRGECELVAAGVRCDGPAAYEGERAARLLAKARVEWRLLLQLSSDDLPCFRWGIYGRIYFWIRRGDLSARAFERVWARLQYS